MESRHQGVECGVCRMMWETRRPSPAGSGYGRGCVCVGSSGQAMGWTARIGRVDEVPRGKLGGGIDRGIDRRLLQATRSVCNEKNEIVEIPRLVEDLRARFSSRMSRMCVGGDSDVEVCSLHGVAPSCSSVMGWRGLTDIRWTTSKSERGDVWPICKL